MEKVTVRTLLERQRMLEPMTSVLEKSKSIEQLLTKQKIYKQATTILYYVSFGKEVFTHNLIKQALRKGKTVLVPISEITTRTLQAAHITSWEDLTPGAYGILEPRKDNRTTVPLESIELILVPGVAFDEKGNRLGHGKGFYDRLLSKIPQKFSIGLAFSFQVLHELPIGLNDKAVHMIITEKQIINCSSY